MPLIDWDIKHGSADWYKRRSGIPTASNFHLILTPKQRKISAARWKYGVRLVCESLLNWQADSLDKVQHIADGVANEPRAIAELEFAHLNAETRTVGLIRTDDGRFGATPDRVVADGDVIGVTIEAKCPTIPIQMERLLLPDPHEEDYICQRQGQMFVAEADTAVFFSWHERMPAYFVEQGRDEVFIRQLAAALEQFSDEVAALHEKAKALGAFQAFAEIVAPLDAELGAAAAEEIVGDVLRGEF